MMQKFKLGDNIRIVKYGSILNTTREEFKLMSLTNKKIWIPLEFKLLWGREMNQEEINSLIPEEPAHIISEKNGILIIDISPQLVGRKGVIVGSYADQSEKEKRGSKRTKTNEKIYEISGIPEKCAWWDEQQLELIE